MGEVHWECDENRADSADKRFMRENCVIAACADGLSWISLCASVWVMMILVGFNFVFFFFVIGVGFLDGRCGVDQGCGRLLEHFGLGDELEIWRGAL